MIRQTVDRIRKLKRRPRRRNLIEPAAVIDLDELPAAERDPRVRQMLETAPAVGKRMERVEQKRRQDLLVYEGSVYVRPIGRGIVLEDEPGEPHLDEWIEAWLTKSAPHRLTSGNFSTRLYIVVEDGRQRTQSRRLGSDRGSRVASVHDLAAYILHEQGSMSPWRLQKLVYYSQAWALVWDDKPLFRARIEAWPGGPVVPALYKRHRGKFSIEKWSGEPSRLAARQETIDAVITPYGKLTGWMLEQIVHTESPWLKARKGTKQVRMWLSGNHA
jgi:uncharacterized phage-associated protein